MKDIFIATICAFGLIVGLVYLHCNRLDIQDLKEHIILLNRSIITNSSADETKVLNTLVSQERKISDKLKEIDSELKDKRKTFIEFTEELHTRVVALGKDQSRRTHNLRQNILSTENQVLFFNESLRFFLPQQRITSV